MATIHQFTSKSQTAKLRCTSCGVTTDAACNCGTGYEYIAPRKLAEKAIKDNPRLSDREIAKKIGVSDRTINRARMAVATNVAIDRRTGKDGKSYKAHKPRPAVVVDEANLLHRELERFMTSFTPRFEKWVASNPYEKHRIRSRRK
jgi:hypothetical protein